MFFRIDEDTLDSLYDLGQQLVETGAQLQAGLYLIAAGIFALAVSHLIHGILTRTRRQR